MRQKCWSLIRRGWIVVAALLVVALSGCINPGPTPTPPTPTAATSPAPTGTRAAPTPTTAQIPDAPADLKAEASDTVIKLTWKAFPDAKGYYVYRDGNEKALNPTPLTETTYEDIGLTNGRTYTYTVAAVDQSGKTGLRSAPVQASPKSK